MKGRKLDRRIEVWVAGQTTDGFGGQETTETLQFTTWARIEEVGNPTRYLNMGFADLENSVEVWIRRRPSLDTGADNIFFKYQNARYTVQHATDKMLTRGFVKYLCKKERISNVISGASGGGFPFVFNT